MLWNMPFHSIYHEPFLVIFPITIWRHEHLNFFGFYVKSALCVCCFCTNVLWYSLEPFWMGNICLHDVKGFSTMENRTKGYNLPNYLFYFSVLKIHISIESMLWKVPTFLTKKLGKFCFCSFDSTKLALAEWEEGRGIRQFFCYLTIERKSMATTWNVI